MAKLKKFLSTEFIQYECVLLPCYSSVFTIFQKQMIDMTRTEGSKLLFEGAHEAAVPAALQALRFR